MHKIVNDGITNFVRTVTKVDIDTLDDGYVVDSSPPPPPPPPNAQVGTGMYFIVLLPPCTSEYVYYSSPSPMHKWVCVL